MNAVPRPRFHLTASGWVNDPLGLTYRADGWHLFFQHLPGENEWNPRCQWGHAWSPDALEWTVLGTVLEPGEGDGGCWSGSVVAGHREAGGDEEMAGRTGRDRIFYTSVDADNFTVGSVRVAEATSADWTAWTKGPVVASLPPGYHVTCFRDPWVVPHGDGWYMVLGAGTEDGVARALLYGSDDLEQWSFLGELASRSSEETEGVWTGEVWECPQLFPIEDRWVLAVAVWRPMEPFYVAYSVGDLEDNAFVPGPWRQLSYGDAYYAPSAFAWPDGRRGLIHWLRDARDPDGSWTGAESLPQVLELEGDSLVVAPSPELAGRRTDLRTLKASGAQQAPSCNLAGACDMVWDAAPGSTLTFLDDEGTLATLHADTDGIDFVIEGRTERVPRASGSIRVVLDSVILEAFLGSAIFASALARPATTACVTGGETDVYALV